eukprot:TRINITY_DN13007_c0_g1_i2.p2 TRINITY_DN13007_c0_g1~~TRINITY_DN13007_c0_g1_i2.p2  ORF type:complete len:100 (-),score=13.43 TRINITY_DN13007_c0_g1_i2:434-733(-)
MEENNAQFLTNHLHDYVLSLVNSGLTAVITPQSIAQHLQHVPQGLLGPMANLLGAASTFSALGNMSPDLNTAINNMKTMLRQQFSDKVIFNDDKIVLSQ